MKKDSSNHVRSQLSYPTTWESTIYSAWVKLFTIIHVCLKLKVATHLLLAHKSEGISISANTNPFFIFKAHKNGLDCIHVPVTIMMNPPYKKVNSGIINENEIKKISRHEITATLEDFIKSAFDLLKDKGSLYLVHRPERLVDIFYIMRKYKIEPKIVQFVYGNKNKEAKLILIKGIKNGNSFLKFEKNIYLYDEN